MQAGHSVCAICATRSRRAGRSAPQRFDGREALAPQSLADRSANQTLALVGLQRGGTRCFECLLESCALRVGLIGKAEPTPRVALADLEQLGKAPGATERISRLEYFEQRRRTQLEAAMYMRVESAREYGEIPMLLRYA